MGFGVGYQGGTRRRLHVARSNCCNDSMPISKEVTLLRGEAARLFEYPSHAAMVVQDKMAANTNTVHQLLGGLRDALAPEGQREAESFGQAKRSHLESGGDLSNGTPPSIYARKVRIGNLSRRGFRVLPPAAYRPCHVGHYGRPLWTGVCQIP
ncbi:hypothetical protein B0T25DRAFT_355043 [Lasiosphaeria hispida]|uniref:Peptidase M3A/M3B catalytic domain-containing protein n=1 Tax=Lasiosphaeria hispida TaxID=260671 RepID=A0AAJ0H733_9PEZI|nr:hypothetical protein B0T25DRAFT_355043 [Lasiosphaeria hispida]